MEGVILAAGYGSRLRSVSQGPKFLLDINGRPLIYYPLYTMAMVGIDKIYIVVNPDNLEYIIEFIDEVNLDVDLDIVVNEDPQRGNGYSLYAAHYKLLGREFILSMSDHIYPAKVLKRIIDYRKVIGKDVDIIVGGDSIPRFIDIDEATKILTDDNLNLIDIGKDLIEYTHIDIGVFLMSRNVFYYAEEYFRNYYEAGLSKLIKWFRDKGLKVKVCDIEGIPWKDIDTPEDLYMIVRGDYKEVLDIWEKGL